MAELRQPRHCSSGRYHFLLRRRLKKWLIENQLPRNSANRNNVVDNNAVNGNVVKSFTLRDGSVDMFPVPNVLKNRPLNEFRIALKSDVVLSGAEVCV